VNYYAQELAGVVVDENDTPIDDAEVSIPMLIIGSMRDEQGLASILAVEISGVSVQVVTINPE
jgi:hypothetical protein